MCQNTFFTNHEHCWVSGLCRFIKSSFQFIFSNNRFLIVFLSASCRHWFLITYTIPSSRNWVWDYFWYCSKDHSTQQKMTKYASVASTHVLCVIAIQMAGTWNSVAVKLVPESGWCITVITEDSREITFSFQCLSITLHQGNAVSFQNTVMIKQDALTPL